MMQAWFSRNRNPQGKAARLKGKAAATRGVSEAMKKKEISKNKMAALFKTSRTQVDRLLDPKNNITLSSLERAAAMVGRRVTIELVQGRS